MCTSALENRCNSAPRAGSTGPCPSAAAAAMAAAKTAQPEMAHRHFQPEMMGDGTPRALKRPWRAFFTDSQRPMR